MIGEKLAKIQKALKAPKSQFNQFGKYNYRSCEDILEAVKPYLGECSLTLRDEIKEVGNIIYVESTAVFGDDKEELRITAQAGIYPNRKGMDIAQSFGSSSSYARKYALAGLFLLDDTKDVDGTNDHGKAPEKKTETYSSGTTQANSAQSKKVETPKETLDSYTELKKYKMQQWFIEKHGPDAMLKFSEMTNGTFKDPMAIKNVKNVEVCWEKFMEYKNQEVM
jgi:hypothetical protein